MAAMSRSSLLIPLALGLVALAPAWAQQEARLPGELTTTRDQALYGVAVLRSQPSADADVLTKLVPGAAITVYPDTSPEGWWFVVMKTPQGVETAGYLPRSFVRMSRGPFRDVPGDHFAADALRRLKETGEMKANSDGDFRGEGEVSRFQMAVVLDRALTRVREAKAAIDEQIAALPQQIELSKDVALQVSDLIRQSEELAAEQKALREEMVALGERIGRQGERLDGMTVRFASIAGADQQQTRRLQELEQTTEFLAAQVAALKRQQLARREAHGLDVLVQLEGSVAALEVIDESTSTMKARLARVERLREITGVVGTAQQGAFPLDSTGE